MLEYIIFEEVEKMDSSKVSVDREMYSDDMEFINLYVNEKLGEIHRFNERIFKIDRKTFMDMHISVSRRLIKSIAGHLVGYNGDGYILCTKIRLMLANLTFSNYVELGHGLYIVIERDQFYLMDRNNIGVVCSISKYFVGDGGLVVDDVTVSERSVDFSKVEYRMLRDGDTFKGVLIDETLFNGLGISYVFSDYVKVLAVGDEVYAFRVFDRLMY